MNSSNDARKKSSVIVALQHASGSPLVCVHPGSGHIAAFQTFPAKLGASQAVYAVRAVGVRDEAPPLASVEEMAARYVDELTALSLSGPITFAGWSIGGAVAIEVARALTKAGRQVGTVVLIDTWAPSALRFITKADAAIHFAHSAGQIGALVGVGLTGDDLRRFPPPKEPSPDTMIAGLEHIILAMAKSSKVPIPERLLESRVRAILRVYAASIRAYQRFEPELYEGRVVLVRANNAEYEFVSSIDPDYGWGPHMKRPVEIERLAGNHFSIMKEDSLDALIGVLKRTIEFDRGG